MKKCPYCGAEIHAESEFCLYCMRELSGKEEIIPPAPENRKKLILIPVAFLIALAVVMSVLAFSGVFSADKPASNPGDIFDRHFENDGENGGFSSYVLFQVRAKKVVSTFGRESLWNTDVFDIYDMTEDGEWYSFRMESCFDGSPFLISFRNGNEQIIASLINLDEDQLGDAYLLSECLVDAIDNNYITDIYEFLTDSEKYPWLIMDDPYYNTMAENGLTGDVYSNVHDEGANDVYRYKGSRFADQTGDQVLLFGLRERTVNGEKKYDIIFDLYHLGEDGK